MLFFMCSATVGFDVMVSGSGATSRDPCTGVGPMGEAGEPSCAEPKTYGRKLWSSRPQTPWDPAGSRV